MNKTLINAFAFLLLILAIGSWPFLRRLEGFISTNDPLNELIDPNKLAVFQGVTANNVPFKSINFEDSETKPSVDGSPNGPRSLFMFAFNKVSPECCLGSKSSGYSTSGGCVCITDKQHQYFSEKTKSLDLLDKCTFP